MAENKPIPLIDSAEEKGGWTFDNGKEFPGAVGKLEMLQGEEAPTLRLHGDFSNGGAYVQAAKKVKDIRIDQVEFEIKVPAGVSKVTSRLIDGTGQCHQLDIRLNDKGGWQKYSFPVERYFSSVKSGSPMDIVTRYQKWSGANDGQWHQPLKLVVFLAGKSVLTEGSLDIRNVRLIPTPPTTELATSIDLNDMSADSTGSWQYNNGNEFKGAQGGLTTHKLNDQKVSMKLSANFSEGGAYVGARRHIGTHRVKTTKMVRFQARTESVESYSVRLVDETGQCHQRGGLMLSTDGQWQTVELDPLKISGGEHWGGADDGQWHGAIKLIEIMLSKRSSQSEDMAFEMSDLQVDSIVEAQQSASAWEDSFDQLQGWGLQGAIDLTDQKEGTALTLHRTLETLRQPTVAISPQFEVAAGAWKVEFQDQASLHSPDNSFHAEVKLLVHNEKGAVVETIPLGVRYGSTTMSDQSKLVTLPANAATAQIQIQLNKTYGKYTIDQLSVSRLEVQPPEPVVKDIRIASEATGNLFYPEDRLAFQLTVNTMKALTVGQRKVTAEVRDYQGNVVLSNLTAPLTGSSQQYQTELVVSESGLNVGQFYELHVKVPQGLGAVAREFSGFAILPEAASKQYEPLEIPFTIRNWDSRIRDYFYLADRLGLRLMGVWGGWKSKQPYKPHLPGKEICEELGAKWITGTPASSVERNGFKTYSEEALREGMKNFLEQYADKGLAMIAMGNEPHGKGQVVVDNVKAYKAIYETVKAHDPEIHVIGTSVEPNEEYFQNGYQDYLDSYDFHIYEHYSHVRRTFREYRELMKKYNAVKPIHSTELGLNSAGQARLTVAIELIKKCTVFFAEGGETVSWFTIQYPDKKGTARGQFGDAHCVFDCKFNNYNPRLDAIAHYNMINALLDKKFVNEEQRTDGTQIFEFRNPKGERLTIVWNDKQNSQVFVPVKSDDKVEVIRIDGARSELKPSQQQVEIQVGTEPQLLLYQE